MSSSIRLVVGSLLSVVGVSLVAMNGIVNFHLRPLGDMMALGAMVSRGGNYSPDWAIAFYEGTVQHIFFIG